MKDVIVVDYIDRISNSICDPRLMEQITTVIANARKNKTKIERRKLKINRVFKKYNRDLIYKYRKISINYEIY